MQRESKFLSGSSSRLVRSSSAEMDRLQGINMVRNSLKLLLSRPLFENAQQSDSNPYEPLTVTKTRLFKRKKIHLLMFFDNWPGFNYS
jgi:hypothetical protein